MSVTINTYPTLGRPLAINDNGATWGILPANVLQTSASNPTVKVTVTTGTPTTGVNLTLFGQVFTINTSNTYSTFIFDTGSTSNTITNILAALDKNFNIAGNYTYSIASNVLTLTWKEKGLNESFTFSGFTQCAVSDASSGQDATLVDDYSILFQGLKYIEPRSTSNSNLEPFTALKNTECILLDGVIKQTPVNLNRYFGSLLWNDFSKEIIFGGIPTFDKGIFTKIKLKAGEQRTVSSALVQSDVKFSSDYKIINARLKASELNLSDYVFNFNISEAKFLNQRPTRFIYDDESVLLYFILQKPIAGGFNYKIKYAGTKTDNTTFDNDILIDSTTFDEYVLAIPAGIQNTFAYAIPKDAKEYTVTMYCSDESAVSVTWVKVSESYLFEVQNCDCCKEEMYFLSEKGAFDTIRLQRIENRSVQVSQTEILKDVIALAGVQTLEEKILGNVRQINTLSSEKITFTTDEVLFNDEEIDFFRQFKQSERRYLKREINGVNYAVPFIVEPSETTVYQFGDTIKLQITGYIGNEQL